MTRSDIDTCRSPQVKFDLGVETLKLMRHRAKLEYIHITCMHSLKHIFKVDGKIKQIFVWVGEPDRK